MIADVADVLDHAHKQAVIHRDVKPSNLLLSAGGRLATRVSAGGKQAHRQNSPPRANASTDVRSAENQRPFLLQQNLYFRPLLQGHGAYGSVPG